MQNITLNTLFTTAQVAQNYGISQDTVRDHLKNHSDEILENIHFTLEFNRFNNKVIKWTLRGIVVLGFFIRSPQAKNFRIWASNELEKGINAELKKAKEARERNLALSGKVAELDALLINKARRHQRQINGYKSQLKQHNSQIIILRHELAKFERTYDSEVIEPKSDEMFKNIDLSDARFKPFDSYRPSYKELYCEYLGVLASNSGLKLRIKMYQNLKG